jgi:hypothetical protein
MYNHGQQLALALIPKITGGCSCAFSFLIVYTIARTRKRRQHTYERLLLGMSFWDMTCSFWYAMSTWPILKEKEKDYRLAVGNKTSCEIQGAFIQMTIVGALYNGSLSFYYVLVTRYKWRECDFRKKPQVQTLLHAIPMVWGIGTVIAAEYKDLFNPAKLWCWIAPDRGADANFFRWAFHYGPLWATILFLTVNLILTVLHLRKETIQAEKNMRIERAQNAHLSTSVEENVMVDTSANVGNADDDTGGVSDAVHATGSHGAVSSSGNSQSTEIHNTRSASNQQVNDPAIRFARRRSAITNQCIRYAVVFYVTWLPMTVRTKRLRGTPSATSMGLP